MCVRKSNLNEFTPSPASVCAVNAGNTNPYFQNDRVVEEFLCLVENALPNALHAIRTRKLDNSAIFAVAGLMSTIYICSPAGVRIATEWVTNAHRTAISAVEDFGYLPPIPAGLQQFGGSIKDLLEVGAVELNVDSKYAQSIGISQILKQTSIFGNAKWEFLVSNDAQTTFLTSDFPLIAEHNTKSMNWTFPLSPEIALKVTPNLQMKKLDPDLNFSFNETVFTKYSAAKVRALNKFIVMAAEDFVFSSSKETWLSNFVRKNRNFRTGVKHWPLELDETYGLAQRVQIIPHGNW